MAGPANAERFINFVTGDPIALADATGSNFGPGYPGLVPPPASPADATQFLSEAGWAVIPLGVLRLRDYIAGLNTSNNSVTPNTKIDIAAGQATNSTNAVLMDSTAVLTIDCATVGANGLDAGALANSTWYHAFLIAKTDGTIASLASTSVAAPVLPSGYTYFRRIASFKTDGSAHIIAYSQFGDDFLWKTPFNDYAALIPGVSTAITLTLNVPLGVQTEAYVVGWALIAAANTYIYLSSFDVTDTACTNASMSVLTPNGQFGNFQMYVRSNTSSQIRARTDNVGTQLNLSTLGWIDPRGKNN